jgi:hypothetical protein
MRCLFVSRRCKAAGPQSAALPPEC